ncbi:MAG: alpha-L-fucosidase [Phycisphaerae bacterium]|nr:alpha-L-fucosidase [Phycisphaerae bacterium]
MKTITTSGLLLSIAFAVTCTVLAQEPKFESLVPPDALSKPPREAVEKWKDMRFGLFMHWGPVSLTGHEIGWSRGREERGTPIAEYDQLYKRWNPERFDAEEWVQIALDMGAKYIVWVTKHHDGFCLWDTKETDYNVMNTPFGRDVTQELADACHKAGLGFVPYYSIQDWYHPDWPAYREHNKFIMRETYNLDRYDTFLKAQCRELIEICGPVTGFWFDTPYFYKKDHGRSLMNELRSIQPDLLVNDRTGSWLEGDFYTAEGQWGAFDNMAAWETGTTLKNSWAWGPGQSIKNRGDVVRMIAVSACGDANFALDTGPMPDGRIEPQQVETLRRVGAWLKTYGESIYGTRGGPFVSAGMPDNRGPNPGTPKHGYHRDYMVKGGNVNISKNWWGGSTHRGNTIYLHILEWPNSTLVLPDIGRKLLSHEVLTSGLLTGELIGGEKDVVQKDDNTIEVSVDERDRHEVDTIVKLVFDQPVTDVAPIWVGEADEEQNAKDTALEGVDALKAKRTQLTETLEKYKTQIRDAELLFLQDELMAAQKRLEEAKAKLGKTKDTDPAVATQFSAQQAAAKRVDEKIHTLLEANETTRGILAEMKELDAKIEAAQ